MGTENNLGPVSKEEAENKVELPMNIYIYIHTVYIYTYHLSPIVYSYIYAYRTVGRYAVPHMDKYWQILSNNNICSRILSVFDQNVFCFKKGMSFFKNKNKRLRQA